MREPAASAYKGSGKARGPFHREGPGSLGWLCCSQNPCPCPVANLVGVGVAPSKVTAPPPTPRLTHPPVPGCQGRPHTATSTT